MRRHQTGVTFIGWVILLIPVAILVYAAIRLVPIYLNHMKVASSINQIAQEHAGGGSVSVSEVRRSIARRFDIEGITYPDPKDIVVARDGEEWVIQASYEQAAPMFAGIQLLVVFDKRVPIRQ
jgi:hypothetical protein